MNNSTKVPEMNIKKQRSDRGIVFQQTSLQAIQKMHEQGKLFKTTDRCVEPNELPSDFSDKAEIQNP